MATGSNDKSVKLTRFDDTRKEFGNPDEVELTMHDGTVRDICFIEDLSNKASLLVSGGAGDCKIYVTDCMTSTPFQALTGHSGTLGKSNFQIMENFESVTASVCPNRRTTKFYKEVG